MKFRLYLSTAFTLLLSISTFAQKFSFENPPDWVKAIDIPEKSLKSEYDIVSGYYLTLADYQVNLEKKAWYTHQVMKIVSYSGISNASQLTVSYDTSYQQLTIHHLYIWRKGVKIDRTNKLALKSINNQENLGNGIYSGLTTLHTILDDIRKDDLIDFAYTTTGFNPIFGEEKYIFSPFVTINPVDLLSICVQYPLGKDYSYRCAGCDSLISLYDANGYRHIEIRSENVPATKFEDYMPSWTIPEQYFMLSSYKSWKEVNLWAQKVFALEKEPDLDSVFQEIFTGDETTLQKIDKIIQYVKNEIRYMGIESGIGSIKPFPPDQVVRQRFGDCKDKSLLLVSLLKKAGVTTAYPALVNTTMQHNLDKYMPSNESFDHCIVMFEYENKQYWIDPTIPMQGSEFRNMYTYNFGKALIIGMPSDTLQTMLPQKVKSGANIVDEFTMSSFSKPAQLTITSFRYGFDADSRRASTQYISSADMSDEVRKELNMIYPVVNKTGDMKVTDDIVNNTFTAVYSYDVADFWQDGDKLNANDAKGLWIFRFEPVYMYNELKHAGCADRKYDYMVNYPLNLDYQTIFHFPKDMLFADELKIYENKAYTFEERIEQISSNTMRIHYLLQAKVKFIDAADFPEMCRQITDIVDHLPVVIYFPKQEL